MIKIEYDVHENIVTFVIMCQSIMHQAMKFQPTGCSAMVLIGKANIHKFTLL